MGRKVSAVGVKPRAVLGTAFLLAASRRQQQNSIHVMAVM